MQEIFGGDGGGGGGGVFVSLSGNDTAGALALISTGTMYIAGGNNLTVSQDGNSLTFSAAAVGAGSFTAGLSTGGNTLGDTGPVANRLIMVGGSNLTLSGSNNGQSATVTFLGNPPFLAGVSTDGNTAGDTMTVSNRLVMVGGTNITLSQATAAAGATVSIIGAADQSGISAIVASDATYTTGTVGFVGSNAATVLSSGAGQTVIIDVPVQTTQTQNLHNVTLAGNTSGALADISSGTMTIAGGNNITLSQNGNAFTISGDIHREAVSINGNITSAGAGYMLISTGTLLLAGGNNITLSQDGHSLTISGANAGGAQTGISSIANSETTYTSGQVVFVGSNNATVRSSGAGQTLIIDVTGAGGAFTGGVSSNGNTAGTTGTVSNGLLLVGGNNVTLSQSSAAGGATVTVSANQVTGFLNSISVIGNTSGDVTAGTGRLILAGGNNVTLSGATGAGAMTLTVSAAGGGNNLSVGVSTIGNTSGETGVFSDRVVFAGGNNITLSGATNASGVTYTISGPSGGGAGMSNLGNTAGTSGTVDYQLVFVGGSNISLSQSVDGSSGTITINGASGGTAAGFSGGMSTAGNTAGTAGTVDRQLVLVGSNNITLSQSVNASSATVTIVGPTGGGAGMTTLGNTAGTAGTVGRELLIVGGANISLSQSINGGSATLTIDGGAGGAFFGGISTDGNTAGTSGVVPGQLVLVGGSNVTLSQSILASSATVTIDIVSPAAQVLTVYATSNVVSDSSGTFNASSMLMRGIDQLSVGFSNGSLLFEAGGGDAGSQSLGISNLGNSAGTSGIASGSAVRYLFAGGSNVTLSQSINGASGTVSIIAGGGAGAVLSQWAPPGLGYSSFTQMGQSSLVMFPAVAQEGVSVSRADLFGSISVSTSSNSSHAGTLSIDLGIYTRNISTMSLASSGSVSYAWNVTGSTSLGSVSGMRGFTVPVDASLTPGVYYIGVVSRTATANTGWVTLSNLGLVAVPNPYMGPFGGATNASNQLVPGLGVFSAQTAALPASVAFSELVASSASTARPVVNFLNFTA